MSNFWIKNCIASLMDMKGRTIKQVFIKEMALIDQGQDGLPVFEHVLCPFLQACVIYLHFEDGEWAHIHACPTDEWSLCPTLNTTRPQPDDAEREETSIYKTREILEFPKGKINSVHVSQTEDQDITEVGITIGTQCILLKLGEVYEGNNSTLRVLPDDESILIFLNADDVKRVIFREPFSII